MMTEKIYLVKWKAKNGELQQRWHFDSNEANGLTKFLEKNNIKVELKEITKQIN